MFQTFRIGRAYKKLPQNHNFRELANNIEHLANELMNQSLGSFARQGYLKAPTRWQWQLGNDLIMLVEYARAHVPSDADGLHHFSGRGHSRTPACGDSN